MKEEKRRWHMYNHDNNNNFLHSNNINIYLITPLNRASIFGPGSKLFLFESNMFQERKREHVS